MKGTQVTYEQRIHHYKENSYITLDPNGFPGAGANETPAYLGNWSFQQWIDFDHHSVCACTGHAQQHRECHYVPSPSSNGGAPIIDPSCAVVTSYQRTYPMRTTMPSEILRFQSTSIK